jgi:hypothetical protein
VRLESACIPKTFSSFDIESEFEPLLDIRENPDEDSILAIESESFAR